MADMYRTLVKAHITEKTSNAYGEQQVYTFVARTDASKHDIARAVETMFDVKVERVRTLVQPARAKSMGRHRGRRPKWKKAYVTLREGDSIEIFGA